MEQTLPAGHWAHTMFAVVLQNEAAYLPLGHVLQAVHEGELVPVL